MKKKDTQFSSFPGMVAGNPIDSRLGNPGMTGAVDIENIIDIFGIYFPNGGKSEAAWEGKLVFYSKFGKYMDELRSQ